MSRLLSPSRSVACHVFGFQEPLRYCQDPACSYLQVQAWKNQGNETVKNILCDPVDTSMSRSNDAHCTQLERNSMSILKL